MKKFTLSAELNQVSGISPRLFGVFNDSHLLGVVKINDAQGFWETHHQGEELLVILSGRARFIALIDGQKQVVEVGAGDILWIPKDAEHSAEIIEELHILFISPKDGNSARVEDGVNSQTERLAVHQQYLEQPFLTTMTK
ncbi:MAG: cupin domain-containing protein [Scytonema sp. RU_4_4]|nr:cupin domain-containing protein [Scytonema sp. RU_4_4]NJR75143.1 cupin domain-containing protein [Scytonema sp. CRU_2_7]